MYQLIWTDFFRKKARKFLKKHPDLIPVFKEIIGVIEINPFQEILKTHSLEGKLKGISSIRFNFSYRIIVKIQQNSKEVIFLNIGSHDEVY